MRLSDFLTRRGRPLMNSRTVLESRPTRRRLPLLRKGGLFTACLPACLPQTCSSMRLAPSASLHCTAAARALACSARDARANLAFASPLRPPPVRLSWSFVRKQCLVLLRAGSSSSTRAGIATHPGQVVTGQSPPYHPPGGVAIESAGRALSRDRGCLMCAN